MTLPAPMELCGFLRLLKKLRTELAGIAQSAASACGGARMATLSVKIGCLVLTPYCG
jgi:hypothetical protein